MHKLMMVALCLCVAGTANSQEANEYEPSEAFKRMEALVGTWQGTLIRSIGDTLDLKINYKVISNRSTIVETVFEDDTQMVTLYYDEGDRLTMTHFCALRNQPVLNESQLTESTLSFDQSPSCTLSKDKDAYVNTYSLTMDPNKPSVLKTRYTVVFPDEPMWVNEGVLERVKDL